MFVDDRVESPNWRRVTGTSINARSQSHARHDQRVPVDRQKHSKFPSAKRGSLVSKRVGFFDANANQRQQDRLKHIRKFRHPSKNTDKQQPTKRQKTRKKHRAVHKCAKDREVGFTCKRASKRKKLRRSAARSVVEPEAPPPIILPALPQENRKTLASIATQTSFRADSPHKFTVHKATPKPTTQLAAQKSTSKATQTLLSRHESHGTATTATESASQKDGIHSNGDTATDDRIHNKTKQQQEETSIQHRERERCKNSNRIRSPDQTIQPIQSKGNRALPQPRTPKERRSRHLRQQMLPKRRKSKLATKTAGRRLLKLAKTPQLLKSLSSISNHKSKSSHHQQQHGSRLRATATHKPPSESKPIASPNLSQKRFKFRTKKVTGAAPPVETPVAISNLRHSVRRAMKAMTPLYSMTKGKGCGKSTPKQRRTFRKTGEDVAQRASRRVVLDRVNRGSTAHDSKVRYGRLCKSSRENAEIREVHYAIREKKGAHRPLACGKTCENVAQRAHGRIVL